MTTELEQLNAKRLPQVFYCRHMIPGVVRYEDEMILVDNDTMKKMLPSMVGKPVYVGHQKVDIENIHQADGYITDCFYNDLDAWAWAKGIVVSDKGHEAVKNGWSVSNAYVPTEVEKGGSHLNVDYNRKIRNGEFTHLAIVPNPRYEEAKIFNESEFKAYQSDQLKKRELANSKKDITEPQKGFSMFKFFKNDKVEITNAADVTDDSIVEIDGKEHRYGDVKIAIENAKKTKKNDDEDEMYNDDEEVTVRGKKMSLGECMNKRAKKNDDDNKAKDETEKANALAAAKAAKEVADAAELVNAKALAEKQAEIAAFNELKNAASKAAKSTTVHETSATQEARGRERY